MPSPEREVWPHTQALGDLGKFFTLLGLISLTVPRAVQALSRYLVQVN